MDAFTAKHLENWLEDSFNDQERDLPRERMTALYESDPEYWGNQGWQRVFDETGLTHNQISAAWDRRSIEDQISSANLMTDPFETATPCWHPDSFIHVTISYYNCD